MLPLTSRSRLRIALLVLGLIVAASGACSSDKPDKGRAFGPLAVMDEPVEGALQALGGTGPVDIGERCVTMTGENGFVVFLVWRSAEVTWDEGNREITFSNAATSDSEPVTISDGDIITIGGGGFGREGATERELRDDPKITWLAEPDESCEGDVWFSVHSVSAGPTPAR